MSRNYPLNKVDYYPTFFDLINGVGKKYAKQTSVTIYDRAGEMHTHSFAKLHADVHAFASALHNAGLKEAHVAIVGANSYEWLIAYMGATLSGGVAVCIDIEQRDDYIRAMIDRADARAIIVTPEMYDVVEGFRTNSKVERFILMEGDAEHPESFEAFIAPGGVLAENPVKDKRQTASIVFTSGTTDEPKPVMLSHEAVLQNASMALAMVDISGKSFAMLPFYHAYGLTLQVLTSLVGGFNMCVIGDLKTMLRDMEAFKPDILLAVPLVCETLHRMIFAKVEQAGKKKQVKMLMRIGAALGDPGLLTRKIFKKQFAGTSLENVKIIMCGGAHIERSIPEELLGCGILTLLGYGITECSPLVSANRNKDFDMGSVGLVLPGFEVKIEEGEILVRGVSLMNGYYGNEALTAASLKDGWLRTGDTGYFDKKHHLHVEGRIKNIIVMKNGKKVTPEEIESAVLKLPLVKEVLAYGASSGVSQDDVKIAVTIYTDEEGTAGMSRYDILAQLQREVDIINATLPAFKQIQMINLRDKPFERTATSKIRRDNVQGG